MPTCMLKIVSKWKWLLTLKVLVQVCAQAGTCMSTVLCTTHGGHTADTHIYIHRNSDLLIVTITVETSGLPQ